MAKRTYNSPRREQAAKETREEILDAAEVLFRTRGFGTTKLADVADSAGVSLATVKVVFGTKRGLLEAVVRASLLDSSDGRPLTDQGDWKAMLAEPDPRRLLARLAALSARLHDGSAELIEAVTKAGSGDPELAEIARRGDERRYADASEVIGALDSRGSLRPGLDPKRATDLLWTLTAPSLYLDLVVDRGWSPEEWSEFVDGTLQSALLPPA